MRFCNYRSGRLDMLVSMSDKELKRLSVLQEICDQRRTQSQAALAHANRGQTATLSFPKNSGLWIFYLGITQNEDVL